MRTARTATAMSVSSGVKMRMSGSGKSMNTAHTSSENAAAPSVLNRIVSSTRFFCPAP